MSPLKSARGLYAITPDWPSLADPLQAVEAVLRGGCRWLQYRDKSAAPAEAAQRARALLAVCRRHQARLIINDDLALALEISADGVHLGGTDGDLAAARAALPPGMILGASCYGDFARAQAAVAAGADYVAFGAVYASPTKPLAPRAELDLFRRARAELPVPACAIGGITLDNAAPVIAAGADLIAVITDLFAPPDTAALAARAAAYQHLFQGPTP